MTRGTLTAILIVCALGLAACLCGGWYAYTQYSLPCEGPACNEPVATRPVVLPPAATEGPVATEEPVVTGRACFMEAYGTVEVTLDNGETVTVEIVSPPAESVHGEPVGIPAGTAAVVIPGCYIAGDVQSSPWPFTTWTTRYDKGGSELGHTLLPGAPTLIFSEWGAGVQYVELMFDDCGTGGCDNGIQTIPVP